MHRSCMKFLYLVTLTLLALFIALSFNAQSSEKKKDKKEKKPEKPITIERIVSIKPNHYYELSPDGKKLLFVNNKGGEDTIFIMDRDGSYPVQITGQMQSFSDPRWSPDGKKIACISKKQIWVMNADGRDPKKITDHGAGARLPRWSPDGKTIAYYSRRKGWSQVWLIDPDGKNNRQLIKIPGDFFGLDWSIDGKYIVASAENMKNLYESDIYLFPVDDGKHIQLTARSGYNMDPKFTKDGKYILFISNRDGWDHIYRVNPDGSDAKKLSTGKFEHEGHEPSPDGKWVAYLRDYRGTRQLWKVSIDGGEPTRIDAEHEGINFIESWAPDSKEIFAQFSSPMEPWGLWIYDSSGKKSRQIVNSFVQGLKSSDFSTPEYVSFTARDGLVIHGYLIKPKEMEKGKKYPAVVYSHGGPTWQFGYRWEPFLSFLAQEGYVVFGVDIRGSTGYGLQFQKANDGEWGHKDMFDLVDAKKYLSSMDFIDPDKVAIYGASYGGYMTLCCMAMSPGTFACGVALYGDSDIAESYKHGDRPGRLDLLKEMGDPELKKEIYRRGSPVFFAENIQDPIMIQHGKDDMRVVPLMSEMIIEKLKIEDKFYEFKFFEGEPHGFYKPENEAESYRMTFKFLEKYLKGKTKDEDEDEH